MSGVIAIVQTIDTRRDTPSALAFPCHLDRCGYLYLDALCRYGIASVEAVANGQAPRVFYSATDALQAFQRLRARLAGSGVVSFVKLIDSDAFFASATVRREAAQQRSAAAAPVGVLVTTPTKSHECDLRPFLSPC